MPREHKRVMLLLALATCLLSLPSLRLGGAAANDDGGPETVVNLEVGPDGIQHGHVALDSYSYSPKSLVVQSGVPVELTLTSLTFLTPHNFVLQAPEAGLAIKVDVGAGRTETVRFTPTQSGSYVFYCDKKLLFFASHRDKGMEGWLDVR